MFDSDSRALMPKLLLLHYFSRHPHTSRANEHHQQTQSPQRHVYVRQQHETGASNLSPLRNNSANVNVSHHHHQLGTTPLPRNRSGSKSPPRTAHKKPPFLPQHVTAAADYQHDDQGNLRDSVTFAQLAAEAEAPDPDGQPYFEGGIQAQPSNASSEPVYYRDPYARYQNAYHGNRYQHVEESDDDDEEEVDFNEHTRRANNNSYSVPIYINGVNKKGKLKKDEDEITNCFDMMSVSTDFDNL